MPAYVPVTNLKLAAALCSIGVRIVDPGITRTREKGNDGKPVVTIGFFFDGVAMDGRTKTVELIDAWNNPGKYQGQSGSLGIMPILRASLDNRERLLDVVKRQLRNDPQECITALTSASKKAPAFILIRKGSAYILLPENAPRDVVKRAMELAG